MTTRSHRAEPRLRGLREPLLIGASAFGVGVVFAPSGSPWLVFLAILLFAAITRRVYRRTGYFSPVMFTLAAFFSGLLVAHLRLPDPLELTTLAEQRAGRPVALEGVIAEELERTPIGVIAIADVVHTSSAGTFRGRARLIFPAAVPGSAGAGEPCGALGDRLQLIATLALPEARVMPVFRTRSLAVRRGVAVSGGVVPGTCARVGETLWAQARALRRALARALAEQGHGDLAALLFGDRLLSSDRFDRTLLLGGQSYLFALRGVNAVALAAGVLLALRLVFLRRPRRGRADRPLAVAAALAIVSVFVLLGPSPSLVRALVTAGIFALLGSRASHFEPKRALAWSLLVVVGLDPSSVGDASFQLAFASLAATFGLFAALRALVAGRWPLAAWFFAPALLALSLALGTTPLISRQFERVSGWSLLANAIALPLEAWVVAPLALFSALAGLAWSALGAAAGGAAEAVAAELSRIAAGAEQLSEAALATPTILECILFYGVLAAISARPLHRRHLIVALLALFGLFASFANERHQQSRLAALEISVLPVERGQSLLVRAAGRSLLIDLGGPSADPEAPARMLSSLLKSLRITEVDALLLTGAESTDEVRSRALSREHEIGEVWSPEGEYRLDALAVQVWTATTGAGQPVAIELSVGDHRAVVLLADVPPPAPGLDGPEVLIAAADRLRNGAGMSAWRAAHRVLSGGPESPALLEGPVASTLRGGLISIGITSGGVRVRSFAED